MLFWGSICIGLSMRDANLSSAKHAFHARPSTASIPIPQRRGQGQTPQVAQLSMEYERELLRKKLNETIKCALRTRFEQFGAPRCS